MSVVASRDLRNHTAAVLRRVKQGERVTVTVNGSPVAEIGPVRVPRRLSMSRNEFAELVLRHRADPALRDDLEHLAGDTTDDLGPIR
jgi:prevent-host-death family protein